MGMLMMIVGYGWAAIGVLNFFVVDHPAEYSIQSGNGDLYWGVLIIGSMFMYWFPGLIIGGIGTIIHRKKKRRLAVEVSTIECPNCAEEIKKAAKTCRFCGHIV